VEKIELYGLTMPLVEEKTDVAKLIVSEAEKLGINVENGDVIVITSKFLQKAIGDIIDLKTVKPSFKAKIVSKIFKKDPVETEIVLKNSKRVLLAVPTGFLREHIGKISKNVKDGLKALEKVKCILITITKNGFIATDAGVDYSNLPHGYAIANDLDFDLEAEKIRRKIKEITGKNVAVVISDTEFSISNGKFGSIDVAVGSSGIEPLTRLFGEKDLYGRPKFGGLDIVVDEICSAAALLMKQCGEGIPVVIIRGLKYTPSVRGVKDVLIIKYRRKASKLLLKIALINIVAKILRII